MFQDKVTKLAKKIEGVIERSYRQLRIGRFYPTHFTEMKLGNEPEVLQALDILVMDGLIRGEVTIRCAQGHKIWTGSVAEFKFLDDGRAPEDCHDCEEDGDFGEKVSLNYLLTKCGRERLDLKETPQKKGGAATAQKRRSPRQMTA